MNCCNHSERDAIGVCVGCGKPICPECKVLLQNKFYCNACANTMFNRATVAIPVKGPNWFERHLNWTSVLSLVAAYVLAFITGIVVGLIMYGNNPNVVQGDLETAASIAGFLVTLAWLLVTIGWVLRKKGQSEWHLLLLLVPFGFLFILGLRNKSADMLTVRPTVARVV